jgi:hypothetical protein
MHRRDVFQSGRSLAATALPCTAIKSQDKPGIVIPTRSRRGFLQIMGGVMLSALPGCAALGMGARAKCELSPDLPMSELVAHLNANIDRINSWSCNDAKIWAEGSRFIAPSLSADMAIERPRNFRLTAKALNIDMVDLGSNDERFWFWGKEENVVLTARHDQMAAAQRQLPLPFEPDWLIEALGVIPLDENEIEFERHKKEPKQVLFKRPRKAPNGAPVELISTVDTCLGVVLEHSLVSQSGKVIALAKMSEHERVGKAGPVVAHTVALSWPQAQLGLKLHMGWIQINPDSMPKQLFQMPDMKCEVVDIGGQAGASRQVLHEETTPRGPRRGKAKL